MAGALASVVDYGRSDFDAGELDHEPGSLRTLMKANRVVTSAGGKFEHAERLAALLLGESRATKWVRCR